MGNRTIGNNFHNLMDPKASSKHIISEYDISATKIHSKVLVSIIGYFPQYCDINIKLFLSLLMATQNLR